MTTEDKEKLQALLGEFNDYVDENDGNLTEQDFDIMRFCMKIPAMYEDSL